MTENPEHELPTARATIIPPLPKPSPQAGVRGWVAALASWLMATRPVRAILHWFNRRGTTLAGGMAYSGLFSIFAVMLVFFSVAGIVLANNHALMMTIIDAISNAVPGLIGKDGVIPTSAILNIDPTNSLTIAGAIALLSAIWTALNFLNGTRHSIRAMFNLPIQINRNFAVMKLVDLGLMVLFGIGFVISLSLTAVSAGFIHWLLEDALAINLSGMVYGSIRVASILITLGFDSMVIAAMLRVLSEVRVPRKSLWSGALLGGTLVSILKLLGTLVVGSASRNPLVATFAALLAVLIFINFLCMVLLLTASWVKVSMDDRGEAARLLTADEAEEITQVTELRARRERLATDRIRVEEQLDQTPVWRHRKARREYERIVDAQVELEREIRARRLDYSSNGTAPRA